MYIHCQLRYNINCSNFNADLFSIVQYTLSLGLERTKPLFMHLQWVSMSEELSLHRLLSFKKFKHCFMKCKEYQNCHVMIRGENLKINKKIPTKSSFLMRIIWRHSNYLMIVSTLSCLNILVHNFRPNVNNCIWLSTFTFSNIIEKKHWYVC